MFPSLVLLLLGVSDVSIEANNYLLQVPMDPMPDIVYSKRRSKSVVPSTQMVLGLHNDHDQEYVPPGTCTTTRSARNTRGTPKKVASGIVTASPYDEERILTGTPSGLLEILREGLAPRKLPSLKEYLAMRSLPGLRNHQLHIVPLLLLHWSAALPRLMRLTV